MLIDSICLMKFSHNTQVIMKNENYKYRSQLASNNPITQNKINEL